MARIRANFISGTVEDNPLTAAATTLTSADLGDLPEIVAPDIAVIILDPDGTPEIVHVTDHAAASSTATILRAQEGTAALEHVQTTPWRHGPTSDDFSATSIDGAVLQVVVWDAVLEAYPARPVDATVVRYIGPIEPTDWADIDEWRVYGDAPILNPDEVASLISWIKADSITPQADDTDLTTWTADVGNSPTQATAANKPHYRTARVNGLPTVQFVKANVHHMDIAAFGVSLTEFTLFVVWRPTTISGVQTIVTQDAAGYSGDLLFGIDPEDAATTNERVAIDLQRSSDSTRHVATDPTAPSTTDFMIHAVHYQGDQLVLYRGRDVVGSDTSAGGVTVTDRAWVLGQSDNTAGRELNGEIAELGIYSSAISGADLDAVIRGLAEKYAITV